MIQNLAVLWVSVRRKLFAIFNTMPTLSWNEVDMDAQHSRFQCKTMPPVGIS